MRTWLSRLTTYPTALVAGSVAALGVAAIVVTFLVAGGDPGGAAGVPKGSSSSDIPGPEDDPTSSPTETQAPADRDLYCPAFRAIRAGDEDTDADDDRSGVDVGGLGRTFDTLIGKYTKAEKVSPLSLRDDYAKALGFLREGKKAADSDNPDLLKALVVNLETLNDSMAAIEKKSAQFCG